MEVRELAPAIVLTHAALQTFDQLSLSSPSVTEEPHLTSIIGKGTGDAEGCWHKEAMSQESRQLISAAFI